MTAKSENTWSMFLHLSQFCGYLIPYGGFLVPLILWLIHKNESEMINQQGIIVLNWIITEIILSIVFGLLCVVLIGIPLLMVLTAVGIIFPIVGAVKASDGILWAYPFSIRFIR